MLDIPSNKTPKATAVDQSPPDTANPPETPIDTLLLEIAYALLAPLFLEAAGGNIAFARTAAFAMIDSYRATCAADLLCVVQIIAYALASLRMVMQTVTSDMPVTLVLRSIRLAESLAKTEERCRRTRREYQVQAIPMPMEPVPTAADLLRQMAPRREPPANPPAPRPEPAQASPQEWEPFLHSPTMPPQLGGLMLRIEKQGLQPDSKPGPGGPVQSGWRKVWGDSAARVAAKFLGEAQGLPPPERDEMLKRVHMMRYVSKELLSGAPLPDHPDWPPSKTD